MLLLKLQKQKRNPLLKQQNWQTVHTESEPRELHRVDLKKNRNKYLFVRVRRSPGVQNEPFSLAKILVYGRK